MMRQVCIHYEDEVPSCMFNAVDVSSAFWRKPELVSKKLLQQRHHLFYISF